MARTWAHPTDAARRSPQRRLSERSVIKFDTLTADLNSLTSPAAVSRGYSTARDQLRPSSNSHTGADAPDALPASPERSLERSASEGAADAEPEPELGAAVGPRRPAANRVLAGTSVAQAAAAAAAAAAAGGAKDKLALPSLRMSDDFVPTGALGRRGPVPTVHQFQRGSRSTLVSTVADDGVNGAR